MPRLLLLLPALLLAPSLVASGLSVHVGAPPSAAPGPAPDLAQGDVLDLETIGALDTPFLVDEDGDRMVGDLSLEQGANLTLTTGDLRCALCIHAADLAEGAVLTAKLADLAVTTPKLADAAVTGPKLGPAAVGPDHLAEAAVTSSKVAPGAVLAGHVAPGAIGGAHLADGSVGYADLAPEVLRPVVLVRGHHPAAGSAFLAKVLHPLSTTGGLDPADAPGKAMIVRRPAVLQDLAVVVDHNGLGFGEGMTLVVRVNGAPTEARVVMTRDTPAGAVLESAAAVPVARGDRVSLEASTGLNSARWMGFGWTFELEAR